MGRNIGPPYALLGPNWIYLGPKLSQMGSTIIAFGPDYTEHQSIWVFNPDQFGPNLGQIMRSWVNLGSIFDPIWAHGWAHGGPKASKRVADSVHVGHLLVASVGCFE
jgi:hypothetical protein